jgi:hypothetical protein
VITPKEGDVVRKYYADVPYVAQKRAMSCWYACAKMVYAFTRPKNDAGVKDAKGVKAELIVKNAEKAAAVDALMKKSHPLAEERSDNIGATEADWPLIAEAFGLEKVPDREVAEIGNSFDALCEALVTYGPLWAAGRFYQGGNQRAGHVICVTGAMVREVVKKPKNHVVFHDPAPKDLQGGPDCLKQYDVYFKTRGEAQNGLFTLRETEGQSPLMYKKK